jgi:hypothetical protein
MATCKDSMDDAANHCHLCNPAHQHVYGDCGSKLGMRIPKFMHRRVATADDANSGERCHFQEMAKAAAAGKPGALLYRFPHKFIGVDIKVC